MTDSDPTITIVDELTIEDPELVLTIFHDKKRQILELLTRKAMTIEDLRIATDINLGDDQRYLEDLQQHKLVWDNPSQNMISY